MITIQPRKPKWKHDHTPAGLLRDSRKLLDYGRAMGWITDPKPAPPEETTPEGVPIMSNGKRIGTKPLQAEKTSRQVDSIN